MICVDLALVPPQTTWFVEAFLETWGFEFENDVWRHSEEEETVNDHALVSSLTDAGVLAGRIWRPMGRGRVWSPSSSQDVAETNAEGDPVITLTRVRDLGVDGAIEFLGAGAFESLEEWRGTDFVELTADAWGWWVSPPLAAAEAASTIACHVDTSEAVYAVSIPHEPVVGVGHRVVLVIPYSAAWLTIPVTLTSVGPTVRPNPYAASRIERPEGES